MNASLNALAERRRRLVLQAADQRAALAQQMEPWRARLARVDQGLAVLRYIGRHPVWLMGAALLLAAWRPRRVGAWLQRGWVLWQVGRRLGGR
jgi:YqjK-like protein